MAEKDGDYSHDDKVDEVDRGGLVESLGIIVRVDPVGQDAEAEPEHAERDAVAFEVPVGHGERGEGLDDAEYPVSHGNQLPVN